MQSPERPLAAKDRPSALLALVAVLVCSFVVRSLPLVWSPLPYNIDGLSEARLAGHILARGDLVLPADSSLAASYIDDMPLLSLVIAFVCAALGLDPLPSSQLVTALLGSVAVTLFFALFLRYWRSPRGALGSALVLAFVGSFVFSAGCTWKETLGFALVALALFSSDERASSPPWRALMTVSLLLLPFAHHHATVVGFVIFTFLVLLGAASRERDDESPFLTRSELVDLGTAGALWAVAVAYYGLVHLPYLDYLRPETDLYLYLAVAFLMALAGVRSCRRDGPLSRRIPLGLLVPVIGSGLMLYNYLHPLFPGIAGPSGMVLVPFLGYLVLVAPAWQGARIGLARRGQAKNLLLAMLLGPLSLILFAFLRANDATSHLIIYRTFDFLMPAFALLAGLGFALVLRGRHGMVAAATGAMLVVVSASTLPVAYQSQELFGVENQTYWFEYDAVQWLSGHGVDGYRSDQRLSETGSRLFDMDNSRGLPYDLREGLALDKEAFHVVELDWSSTGAQEFPFGTVVVDADRLSSLLDGSTVFYIGGPPGGQVVGLRTR